MRRQGREDLNKGNTLGILSYRAGFYERPDTADRGETETGKQGDEQLGNSLTRVTCVEIMNTEGTEQDTQNHIGARAFGRRRNIGLRVGCAVHTLLRVGVLRCLLGSIALLCGSTRTLGSICSHGFECVLWLIEIFVRDLLSLCDLNNIQKKELVKRNIAIRLKICLKMNHFMVFWY